MTPPPFPQVRKKHPQKAPSLIRVKWSCQEDISLGILGYIHLSLTFSRE